jgi:predicted outer membrane lipoprotein
MNATTILGIFGALAFVVAIVALLEHLDCRARERRWQRARDSFTR